MQPCLLVDVFSCQTQPLYSLCQILFVCTYHIISYHIIFFILYIYIHIHLLHPLYLYHLVVWLYHLKHHDTPLYINIRGGMDVTLPGLFCVVDWVPRTPRAGQLRGDPGWWQSMLVHWSKFTWYKLLRMVHANWWWLTDPNLIQSD